MMIEIPHLRVELTGAFGGKEVWMLVKVLESIHYPPDGSSWRSLKTRDPDWPAIEEAIRRLDRDEWPFIWLHIEEPPENDMPNNMFCVMGGRGEYDLSLYRDGDEIHYWDRTRSDEVIRIWVSDQGSYKSYQNLCNDLPLVLEITRRFAESGALHPGVSWDKW
jgi:hypothetical protein